MNRRILALFQSELVEGVDGADVPTSLLVMPTLLKKVVMAASSSASASTPLTPQMSMFH